MIIDNMSNKEYHAHKNISKSSLDYIEKSISLYQWARNAPEINKGAKEIGTYFHECLLEPNKFSKLFVEPSVNRRTNAGKEELEVFHNRVNELGGEAITSEQDELIKLMHGSALMHPTFKYLYDNQIATETSFFSELCGVEVKCRPDMISHIGEQLIIVDIKTSMEINRFSKSIYDYRYHVQDSFYSDIISYEADAPVKFYFFVVGTKLELGRYPVRLFELDDYAKESGRDAYKNNLYTYQEAMIKNNFYDVEKISLPGWAV